MTDKYWTKERLDEDARQPSVRLTDKGFKYTPSFATDLKARFRKIRREAAAKQARPTQLKAVV